MAVTRAVLTPAPSSRSQMLVTLLGIGTGIAPGLTCRWSCVPSKLTFTPGAPLATCTSRVSGVNARITWAVPG